MTKKYIIKPENGDKFLQLFQQIPVNDLDKQALSSVEIKHVEIDVVNQVWEILIESYNGVRPDSLRIAEKYIAKALGLKQVIFYQNITGVADELAANWQFVQQNIVNKYPHLREAMTRLQYEYKDAQIVLTIATQDADLLGTTDIQADIRQSVLSLVHGQLEIIFEIVTPSSTSLAGSSGELYDNESTKEAYLRQLQTTMMQNARQVSKENPVATVSTNNDSNSKYNRRKERKLIVDAIPGNAQEIMQIEGEQKNIIVEGGIYNINFRTFNTGTNLYTFDIADDNEGISCKVFAKQPEAIAEIKDFLQEGKRVKIRGEVRFDRYTNDFCLMPMEMMATKVIVREDNATEKRVELHVHTHMSNMDAVVSAKELINTAIKWGWPAIAITDHGVVQAFPEAMSAAEGKDIKVIYGVEAYLTDDDFKQRRANHIILLAKNATGLRNIYRLVSLSHLKYLYKSRPRIPRFMLEELREGIIVGSACEAGELIRAIVAQKSDEELLQIASFYDYLEVQPIANNAFLIRSEEFSHINTDEDLIKINLKVAELARTLNKPLVATCDVHFLTAKDSVYRAILMKSKGFSDAELQPPLYLRTTEEMLREFEYLGPELCYEAVVTNPRKIAAMVEKFKPIPDELYSPMIPGADEAIHDMSYAKARELYGDPLPQVVQERLDLELNSIIGHGFAVLYLIAHKLVKKSLDDGYLVGSRGSVGSSFVATMTDITEVNPLPPHWRCPQCLHSEFITDGSYSSGFDMPRRHCPHCNTLMVTDGHDIPFAVFMGFDGDKVPDIDLNFSGVYQPVAHKYTEELFGKDNVFRAGTISKVASKTAYGYVKKFFEEKGIHKREAYLNSLVSGCKGVKRTTGQHPGGIMVVPRNMDVHYFTPIQHPADDKETNTITTHFDYHSISSRLVKLDILGHDDPTVIKMLENITKVDPRTIPFDDPETMSIFSSTTALKVTPEELGANSGTFGIPEFRTRFTRQMLDDTKPQNFSDLVRISGFSHGTDVWSGNAQDLITSGVCKVGEAISCRDDIMMNLIHSGLDPLFAFKTMEKVRKGKGLADSDVETMKKGNIPQWYIDACKKIKYLFPRAHATAYVMMAYRIAYCKVHYPLEFYAAYFSVRAADFDADLISQGKAAIRERLDQLNSKDGLSEKDKELQIVLELSWEMYLRGFSVQKVDLYRSEATTFVLEDNTLLPPLTGLVGISTAAATNIVRAREEYAFTSIEDLKRRASLSTPMIEALRNHGCLVNMQESDQMSLFAI